MSERYFNTERTATGGGCQGTEMVGLPYNAFVRWPATIAAFAVTLGTAGLLARATPDLGTRDRALERQFTPIAARDGAYVISTVETSITELAAELKSLDGAPTPGAWQVAHAEAHEAFGQAGLYDRFQLAELFGGQRLSVVRGSLVSGGYRTAYTLISPYPDGTLSRIVHGTMVIQVSIGTAGAGRE
jgi:hypothetical protein